MARHSDIRLTMNIYTHTDLDEKVAAVAKLPSFRASILVASADSMAAAALPTPPEATETEDPEQAQQRHSSTLVAEDGIDGQFVSEDDKMPVGSAANDKSHKSLDSMDLASHDTLCHDRKQIRPIGFEPITLGSEEQLFSRLHCCKTPLNQRFLC